MKKCILFCSLALLCVESFAWGFYAHRLINRHAVFLLPPEMMVLYKPNINWLSDHATDPDSRRYIMAGEGPRHYIDIDGYGKFPYDSLPRKWSDAVARFGEDSLSARGIVPWWIQVMLARLTKAFREQNLNAILKLSAEIGHYVADAHVPLHASSNHNGQFTNQHGIHAFWESRIPELLAETEWDLFTERAAVIHDPLKYTWQFVLESAAAADSVLKFEAELNRKFSPSAKYAFEPRNGSIIKQYSSVYSLTYNAMLAGMVERRLRQSIRAVAAFWITAWVNAGQPALHQLTAAPFSETELAEMKLLQQNWKTPMIGKTCH